MSLAVLAFVQADTTRAAAADRAADRARVIAQTKLAPLFDESDLGQPVTGARYDSIAASVGRSILERTDVEHVTLWSQTGRVIFADDPALVGTRPTYIRDLVRGVAHATTQTKVEAGTLKTFTPIWREAGGTVAVAELDQPFGAVEGTAGRLFMLVALVLGVASLVCWVLFAAALRSRTASPARPPVVYAGPRATEPGRAQALGPVMAAAPPSVVARLRQGSAPVPPEPQLREAEKARTEAEQRARAAEERLARLQLQHRQAMDRLQALENRLSMAAAAPKQTQEELRALRDQVRESAERLHTAELENERLRARLGTPHLPGAVRAGGSAR